MPTLLACVHRVHSVLGCETEAQIDGRAHGGRHVGAVVDGYGARAHESQRIKSCAKPSPPAAGSRRKNVFHAASHFERASFDHTSPAIFQVTLEPGSAPDEESHSGTGPRYVWIPYRRTSDRELLHRNHHNNGCVAGLRVGVDARAQIRGAICARDLRVERAKKSDAESRPESRYRGELRGRGEQPEPAGAGSRRFLRIASAKRGLADPDETG